MCPGRGINPSTVTAMIARLLSLLLLSFSACSVEEPRAAREPAEAPPENEPAKTIPEEDIPSPPDLGSSAGTPIEAQDQERLRALIQAMAQAADESAEAEGLTECERAFESTVRFAASLRESMGSSAPRTEPNRAEFIRSCNQLPENVQRCMVMAYSVSHQEECSRVRGALSEADRERVRRLSAALGSAAADPEEPPPPEAPPP
jgi:hypothetical protein